MKKLLVLALIAWGISAFSVSAAQTVTLNFDEYNSTGTGFINLSSYSGSGFIINATESTDSTFQIPKAQNQYFFGSASLLYNRPFAKEWAILSAQDNSLFTLNSVDLHGLLGGAQTVNFYAFDAGQNQTGQGSLSFDDAASWHQLTFGGDFQEIASVRWQQASPFFLMDNISLTRADVVPEPVSFLLYGLGAVALGAAKRKKNKR